MRPTRRIARASAALTIALLCSPVGRQAPAQEASTVPYPALGSIEVKDDRLRDVIPEGEPLRILASGFEWSEGPVWWGEKGALLFSDIPRNTVFLWTEAGGIQTYLKPSGYTGSAAFTGQEPGSNGLLFGPDGRLILCQHGDRRVSRLGEDGSFETLADAYDGKRLNSPNDAVLKSDGSLYFTDPPYGLPGNVDDPEKELDFQGVYRLSPDGELTLLTEEMSRPNGIGFSPDEKTLYVANSDPERAIWMAFPVNEDGTLGEGKAFADVTDRVGKLKGLPDGLAVSRDGTIFATGPGGVLVFSPDGTELGAILTGEATANCTLGGEDGSTLFVTADMYLCRIPTKVTRIGGGE
ncbi:SMP-30/gluconolactonase/LRE family protein [Tautonia plasticadhaerens]|uniref:Gluconolactonase n=1 Tax=Tautonia plasticadhaerens TaxID=2527974 RepID=A0A518H7F5_9BACT|nr:SMP-30/gluconolactonase/LRE family protein [Tautonia plasticadhaerens]QDV36721.1 Gluconolactonase precursor [Tautonia plasticadhaerens]